jgi:E3 ubiquitin-protein ligase MARCH6
MNLTFVLCELAIPAIVTLGLALALPYVVAHSIVPFFGEFILKGIIATT